MPGSGATTGGLVGTTRRARALTGCALLATIGLAACSSSAKTTGSPVTSTTGANTPVSASTASAPASAGSNWVASYLGAKAQPADKSLSPVVIGYVNMEGGT